MSFSHCPASLFPSHHFPFSSSNAPSFSSHFTLLPHLPFLSLFVSPFPFFSGHSSSSATHSFLFFHYNSSLFFAHHYPSPIPSPPSSLTSSLSPTSTIPLSSLPTVSLSASYHPSPSSSLPFLPFSLVHSLPGLILRSIPLFIIYFLCHTCTTLYFLIFIPSLYTYCTTFLQWDACQCL